MEPCEFEETDQCHVAFKLPVQVNSVPQPYPCQFSDCWESKEHIKMPNSNLNEISFVKQNGELPTKVTFKKWDLIREKLSTDALGNCKDLITAIKSYNPLMVDDDFVVLEAVLEDCFEDGQRDHFFSRVLPAMVQLALDLPLIVTKPLPVLKQNLLLHISQEISSSIQKAARHQLQKVIQATISVRLVLRNPGLDSGQSRSSRRL